MQAFSVDKSRCIQCGQCIYTCNRQILAADADGFPFLSDDKFEQCNACGHCSAICPTDAVISPKSGGEKAASFSDSPDMNFDSVTKYILPRRSLRRTQQEPVK